MAAPGCAAIDNEHSKTHLPGSSSGCSIHHLLLPLAKSRNALVSKPLLIRVELGSQPPETEGTVVNRGSPV